MQLCDDKLLRMADHQRNLIKRDAELLQVRKSLAVEEIQTLVEKFRAEDPAISKIILFGSIARNNVRSLHFDIDLAVECSSERYLSLVVIALNSSFPVDVVDLRTADDRIKNSVARDGVVLYEK